MWIVNEISCADGLEIKRQWVCDDYEEALGQAVHVIITDHDKTLSNDRCRELFETQGCWHNDHRDLAISISHIDWRNHE